MEREQYAVKLRLDVRFRERFYAGTLKKAGGLQTDALQSLSLSGDCQSDPLRFAGAESLDGFQSDRAAVGRYFRTQ